MKLKNVPEGRVGESVILEWDDLCNCGNINRTIRSVNLGRGYGEREGEISILNRVTQESLSITMTFGHRLPWWLRG